ncbi:MAG TPA: DUF4350 domain-containing protein [Bacteroidia bacterium]|jgi:hypothetical protein|nr:DUF4350 domain-containing protein [Bacteroidia bacterium]
MKKNRRTIIFLIICFVVLFILQYSAPKPIDWRPTYKYNDKIPYGVEALYKTLPLLFPKQAIKNADVPIYNTLVNQSMTNTSYIIINQQFDPDKLGVQHLLNFVKNGNTAFIAANYFGDLFRDTLKFDTSILFGVPIKKDSLKVKFSWQESINLNFYNPLLKSKNGYTIEILSNTYFSSFDTANVEIIGNVNQKEVNFIKIHFGKGDFFILTSPEAFINYNFVNQENSEYVSKALSYVPKQKIIWDEYYKMKTVKEQDEVSVIMSKSPLATAYYLLIGSILLLMLIGIKRKQRIIPVIEPFRNTTLDFVNTIGTLYYQNGTHKDIAVKQINHFLSFIHTTFRVDIGVFDTPMITKVANRSGVEAEKISRLFNLITTLKAKQTINEHELLQLNLMIEDFYKQNKR